MYLGATDSDHCGRTEDQPQSRRGSEGRGRQGGPWSRYYQFSIKHYSQHNPQRIWKQVSRGGGQAACLKFLAHQAWATSFIVRRWVWDSDMPAALVLVEMGLGKTFTSLAAAMICTLLTEKVVMGLLLSIICGNTLADYVNMVLNDFSGTIGEEREWYPLWRHNSMPHRIIEIQKTPLQGHPALISALESILVVTMHGVAERFKSVIDEMTYSTDFNIINLLHTEYANLPDENLNTCLDKPETRWNIHFVSYDTLTSRAKPLSNGQLSHSSSSLGIVDESHCYKIKNSVVWQIAMNGRIGFKLQVTATPEFHSLYDWCFQTMWLFSGAAENSDDDTGTEMEGAEAVYSAVKSLMHAIRTEDEVAQQDAAHRMIKIAKPWSIRWCSELRLANGIPLVWVAKKNAHLVDLECTQEQ